MYSRLVFSSRSMASNFPAYRGRDCVSTGSISVMLKGWMGTCSGLYMAPNSLGMNFFVQADWSAARVKFSCFLLLSSCLKEIAQITVCMSLVSRVVRS